MRLELLLFVLLLVINFIITLLYVAVNRIYARTHGEQMRDGICFRAAVMLLCPLIGPCLFFLGFIMFRTVFQEPVDLEDVIFSKDRVKTYSYADEEQERNIVPVEDAIAVSDTESLRSLMMNVVRGDIKESLTAIATALNSEDSETSHYAASVLQEALDKFRMYVQKGYQALKTDTQNQLEYAEILLDYMNPVLVQRIFTEVEQRSMVYLMDDVGEILYEQKRKMLTSARIEAISLRLLEISDYENCQKWCERAEYLFPDELATYTCQLKLFFTMGRRSQFFQVLRDLQDSDVIIDNETLELIRVFL